MSLDDCGDDPPGRAFFFSIGLFMVRLSGQHTELVAGLHRQELRTCRDKQVM